MQRTLEENSGRRSQLGSSQKYVQTCAEFHSGSVRLLALVSTSYAASLTADTELFSAAPGRASCSVQLALCGPARAIGSTLPSAPFPLSLPRASRSSGVSFFGSLPCTVLTLILNENDRPGMALR